MFNKLGLQVYTVRDHIKDEQSMNATFAKLAEIGYSELQTAGWESETYATLAKKHGLTVVGTHYNYDKIINNIDETVALHKALGTTNIGVGGCSARSYDEIMEFIEKYNAAAAEYAKHASGYLGSGSCGGAAVGCAVFADVYLPHRRAAACHPHCGYRGIQSPYRTERQR